MKLRAVALMFATIAVVGIVGGCGSNKKKSNASTTPTTAKTVTAPGATVSFVAPKKGSSVGKTVTAKVKLSHFKLAPKEVGKPAKQGEGHLHFALDEGKYDYPKYSGANGKLAVKLGVQGKYSPSVTRSITYKNLPPGKHKLEVYLANNDHTNTGVEGSTEFTVKGGGASSGAASSSGGGGGSGY
jgi:uncharacterized membrane protein YgcG